MPGLIEHIDAIARKKQRAVLYLEFHPEPYREWRNYSFEDDAWWPLTPAPGNDPMSAFVNKFNSKNG